MGEDWAQIASLNQWLDGCEYGYSGWKTRTLLIIFVASLVQGRDYFAGQPELTVQELSDEGLHSVVRDAWCGHK